MVIQWNNIASGLAKLQLSKEDANISQSNTSQSTTHAAAEAPEMPAAQRYQLSEAQYADAWRLATEHGLDRRTFHNLLASQNTAGTFDFRTILNQHLSALEPGIMDLRTVTADAQTRQRIQKNVGPLVAQRSAHPLLAEGPSLAAAILLAVPLHHALEWLGVEDPRAQFVVSYATIVTAERPLAAMWQKVALPRIQARLSTSAAQRSALLATETPLARQLAQTALTALTPQGATTGAKALSLLRESKRIAAMTPGTIGVDLLVAKAVDSGLVALFGEEYSGRDTIAFGSMFIPFVADKLSHGAVHRWLMNTRPGQMVRGAGSAYFWMIAFELSAIASATQDDTLSTEDVLVERAIIGDIVSQTRPLAALARDFTPLTNTFDWVSSGNAPVLSAAIDTLESSRIADGTLAPALSLKNIRAHVASKLLLEAQAAETELHERLQATYIDTLVNAFTQGQSSSADAEQALHSLSTDNVALRSVIDLARRIINAPRHEAADRMKALLEGETIHNGTALCLLGGLEKLLHQRDVAIYRQVIVTNIALLSQRSSTQELLSTTTNQGMPLQAQETFKLLRQAHNEALIDEHGNLHADAKNRSAYYEALVSIGNDANRQNDIDGTTLTKSDLVAWHRHRMRHSIYRDDLTPHERSTLYAEAQLLQVFTPGSAEWLAKLQDVPGTLADPAMRPAAQHAAEFWREQSIQTFAGMATAPQCPLHSLEEQWNTQAGVDEAHTIIRATPHYEEVPTIVPQGYNVQAEATRAQQYLDGIESTELMPMFSQGPAAARRFHYFASLAGDIDTSDFPFDAGGFAKSNPKQHDAIVAQRKAIQQHTRDYLVLHSNPGVDYRETWTRPASEQLKERANALRDDIRTALADLWADAVSTGHQSDHEVGMAIQRALRTPEQQTLVSSIHTWRSLIRRSGLTHDNQLKNNHPLDYKLYDGLGLSSAGDVDWHVAKNLVMEPLQDNSTDLDPSLGIALGKAYHKAVQTLDPLTQLTPQVIWSALRPHVETQKFLTKVRDDLAANPSDKVRALFTPEGAVRNGLMLAEYVHTRFAGNPHGYDVAQMQRDDFAARFDPRASSVRSLQHYSNDPLVTQLPAARVDIDLQWLLHTPPSQDQSSVPQLAHSK